MSVWVCLPSKRSPAEVDPLLAEWHRMGYKSIVLRDEGDPPVSATICDFSKQYLGWGGSINVLAREVFQSDQACDWIVAGSDDIWPDTSMDADSIAQECHEWFSDWNHEPSFGVMQPIGDLEHWPNSRIDRICGSPWLGREFCRRMYGGRGPFFPDYRHMFDDEELQCVAEKLGVLWQRKDLTHRHEHFMRHGPAPTPKHLEMACSKANWDRTKQLFMTRKATGFPGHEPIP